MFIRIDAVRSPLQHPYDGPFPVLHRYEKFFTFDINGRIDNLSIDRLKPVFVNHPSTASPISPPPDTPSSATTPMIPASRPSYSDIVRRNPTTTRFGRPSNPVQRYGV